MKSKSLIALILGSFPFFQAYRLRKQMQRKRMYKKVKQERNKYLKRYLILAQSIRRF